MASSKNADNGTNSSFLDAHRLPSAAALPIREARELAAPFLNTQAKPTGPISYGPPAATAPPAEFRVRGRIDRIIYEAPEDGYCIFTVQREGTKSTFDQEKVKGYGFELKIGQDVDCLGVYEAGKNPRYPDERILKAVAISEIVPTTVPGIRKLLHKGFVKGIGPKYADLLLAHFGAGLFDTAERSPHLIMGVPGLGEARSRAFINAVSEKKAVPRIMSFLAEIGLGPGLSHRVFKELGTDAVKKIKANPYSLTAVPLIAFATADRIARQMGVPLDSTTRIEAGLQAMLMRESDNGSTAVLRNGAIEKTGKLLSYSSDNGALGVVCIPPEKIKAVLQRAIDVKNIVELRMMKNGDETLSSPEFVTQESSIAANILRLMNARSSAMRHVDTASPHFAHLDEGQREAARMALTSNVSVITGGPGCGKTTVTKSIIKALQDSGLTYLACGPTGRAAKRFMEATGFEASTMHRALESRGPRFERNEGNPLVADFIIADEQSMSDTYISHCLLKAVASGSQLLYVGDVDQLSSIGAGAVLKDIIKSGRVPVSKLTKIHRQAEGSDIITNAHAVNAGKIPVSSGSSSDFSMVGAASSGQVAAVITQYEKLLKDGFLPEDIQILTPRRQNSDLGANALNKQMKEFLNPGTSANSIKRGKFEDEITFSTGDRVMQVSNNKDLGIYNGDIGYILSIDKIAKEIAVDFSGETVVMTPDDLKDLDLAYATTIHKSQGSEFPAVIIPVSNSHWMMWDRNLMYTAITRGKTDVSLVGDMYMLKKIVEKENASLRVTGLADEIEMAFARNELKHSSILHKAKKAAQPF